MAARWGSLLQQAVAGVESRLDTILAESDDERNAAQPGALAAAAASTASPKVTSSANSRASSTNRTNDRLQARLAKAMAGKNAPAAGDNRSPRSSIDVASRSSMERPSMDIEDRPEPAPEQQPETELESSQTAADSTTTAAATSTTTTVTTTIPITITDDDTTTELVLESAPNEIEGSPSGAEGQHVSEEAPLEEEEAASPPPVQDEVPTNNGHVTLAVEDGADASELSRELEEVKSRHREEVQEYVERIDSLQSKLQFLSKSAADSASKAASSAPSGSLEKKLAEKDERIALLMEEGQKLAGADHKYRSMIKTLRLQISERDKQLDEARKAKDKAASEIQVLRSRLDGDEEKEKRRQEAIKATATLRKEIDNLKKESTNKDAAIRRLEQEVKAKEEQGEVAKADALSKAIAAERVKQKELEEANATVRAELEALGEKARLEAIEWGEKHERAVQRGTTVEAELRLELQSMERKLEGVRVTAEEAASGTGGEAQVKLFRQIETLQTQYATARQNWQGIEASLMAKTTSLERERNEAERRESEMRKKARDAAKRGRALEDELQDAQLQLDACREELATLQKSTKATETALEQTRSELDKEKRAASRVFTAEAGRQWADEVAGATSRNQSRPESPLLSVPRTFSSEAVGLSVPNRIRRSPTPVNIADAVGESLGILRRPPMHLPTRTGTGTMSLTGSIPPLSPFSPLDPPLGSPPALPPSVMERENGISDTAPSSPRNLAQDMISVSTVAAGPSVQLVERMSAAIRRLEAERVAAKEEMARVCSQRDEARGDMVGLMKELEDAKAASARVLDLEKQVADLDTRYQTTLELLGEKSELVDELRADVDDVKTMYRELVERTVK
ncbi:TATA element modulatory factor 1 TATA binding domain-containing protein [Trichoderma barbatum]